MGGKQDASRKDVDFCPGDGVPVLFTLRVHASGRATKRAIQTPARKEERTQAK